jgi:deoxycytidylate deaminase
MGHNQYIVAAIEQALKSPMGFQHGAVIVSKGNIVARGYNRYIMTCMYSQISIHAEADAIGNCSPRDLYGATLYVVRFRNGHLQMSKPCKSCTRKIDRSTLGGVYYSTRYSLYSSDTY